MVLIIGIQIYWKVDHAYKRFGIMGWFFVLWLIIDNFKGISEFSELRMIFCMCSHVKYLFENELFGPKTKREILPSF